MADKNWFSVVRENAPDLSGFQNPPDPENYSDILKFSSCTNVTVEGKEIIGGKENCIDAVRGAVYLIKHCVLRCRGTAAVVIKGAIDGWEVRATTIEPCGATDLEIGMFNNYWVPFDPPTRNGIVRLCETTTGAAIRVQCWDADKPDVGVNVVVTKVPFFIWFPYFSWRYLAVRISGQVPWVFRYNPPQTPTKNGISQ
jgi:hypothetical protein